MPACKHRHTIYLRKWGKQRTSLKTADTLVRTGTVHLATATPNRAVYKRPGRMMCEQRIFKDAEGSGVTQREVLRQYLLGD